MDTSGGHQCFVSLRVAAHLRQYRRQCFHLGPVNPTAVTRGCSARKMIMEGGSCSCNIYWRTSDGRHPLSSSRARQQDSAAEKQTLVFCRCPAHKCMAIGALGCFHSLEGSWHVLCFFGVSCNKASRHAPQGFSTYIVPCNERHGVIH